MGNRSNDPRSLLGYFLAVIQGIISEELDALGSRGTGGIDGRSHEPATENRSYQVFHELRGAEPMVNRDSLSPL